ncbi:MAG: aromatic-ring-hydroxylating dioxygenase subunit beta [Bacteroidetes bacterium]|jgi:benzoate/toluate 1,2-dioxygenase beta subunit|nr:aromatic-ring-hydroxylating dioxygenase subunit beta [Bacteroidota bacterium]
MAKAIDDKILRKVEQYLYDQSDMLDTGQWQNWMDLFTDDGVYWMPSEPGHESGEGVPSIFYEDKYLMRTRRKRLEHPRAWSQSPSPRANHLVGNVRIDTERSKGEELVVTSKFHVVEFRLEKQRYFTGTYTHHLVPEGDSYRIRHQRVDLLNYDAPFDYVLQVWL